jgi:RND superfamily putative drug exporter
VSLAIEALVAGGGALLVLAFVFASWMAIVPLLMAMVAIPTTFLLIWPLATATDVSVIVKFLAALIGLAIAIDYALLVVVRWREERLRPETSNEAAVVKAMQHAGRAVVFSGSTVGISLLALVVLPVPFLRSLGIAGMLIPLVSVAVAVTLLPSYWQRSARGSTAVTRAARIGSAAGGRPGLAASSATAESRS